MRIEVVSFDAAGTLFGVAEPVAETYLRYAVRFGIEVCSERLATNFREAFTGMPPMAFGKLHAVERRHQERRWWRQLVQRVFGLAQVTDAFGDCFEALFAHYDCRDAWQVFPEVSELLPALRAAGHRLTVTSNFDSRLEGLLEDLGLAQSFDCVNYSSQAGSEKPDSGIFEHMLVRMRVEPAAVCHVGDSFSADYQGSARAGLLAVWLQREQSAPLDPCVTAIRTLSGIWPHLVRREVA